MNKVTRVKNSDYTTISNVFLREAKLSLKAKGLLATILSLPESWDFSIKGLCAIVKEGNTAIYSAIDELKAFGYCKVEILRDEKGRVTGNDYTFLENPNMENLNMVNQTQLNKEDNKEKNVNKEGDIDISPKKQALDYSAIVDCWNENNGKCCGKVERLTERRKQAIKKIISSHGITQEELMNLFKALPFADSWLYNPTREHKNWKPDFDWWMANTNGWFTKALEGKVHTQNQAAFNDIMQNGKESIYTPHGNLSIMWDDNLNAYLYIGFYSDGMMLADGYENDNRPDGASLVLNNGRGTITWSSTKKIWERE